MIEKFVLQYQLYIPNFTVNELKSFLKRYFRTDNIPSKQRFTIIKREQEFPVTIYFESIEHKKDKFRTYSDYYILTFSFSREYQINYDFIKTQLHDYIQKIQKRLDELEETRYDISFIITPYLDKLEGKTNKKTDRLQQAIKNQHETINRLQQEIHELKGQGKERKYLDIIE